MIAGILKRKEFLYCLLLSYFLLLVGTVPLVVPVKPSLSTPMMAGNLAHIVLLYSTLVGMAWLYMKGNVSSQGVSLSIVFSF